jgi:hypothetical protein
MSALPSTMDIDPISADIDSLHLDPPIGTDVPTQANLCLWIAHPSRHWSTLVYTAIRGKYSHNVNDSRYFLNKMSRITEAFFNYVFERSCQDVVTTFTLHF